jgi:predicted nucleic acid-binding protein
MEQKFLIDTNIILGLFAGKIAISKLEILLKHNVSVSIVTYMETLGWQNITPKEIVDFNDFFSNTNIFQIDYSIVEKTIALKQKLKIKLPDAIIAATAIVNNLTLATRNVKDFNKINELKIWNPFE